MSFTHWIVCFFVKGNYIRCSSWEIMSGLGETKEGEDGLYSATVDLLAGQACEPYQTFVIEYHLIYSVPVDQKYKFQRP